jgi:hypothetical protein
MDWFGLAMEKKIAPHHANCRIMAVGREIV